jgi:hypothetical protein
MCKSLISVDVYFPKLYLKVTWLRGEWGSANDKVLEQLEVQLIIKSGILENTASVLS